MADPSETFITLHPGAYAAYAAYTACAAYNMPSDQVGRTVCDKFRVSFLPTRSYRVLIAVNQGRMRELLFSAHRRNRCFSQEFSTFFDNCSGPAGGLEGFRSLPMHMARALQKPLVSQRFCTGSGLRQGVVFFCPASRKQCRDAEKLFSLRIFHVLR